MQQVTIEKAKLIAILKENQEAHNEIYKAAVELYWKELEASLSKKLEASRKREKISYNSNIHAPTSYEDEFKKVIRMLELSVDAEVTLTNHEFDQYVMNNWQWAGQFLATTTSYLNNSDRGEFVLAKAALSKFNK